MAWSLGGFNPAGLFGQLLGPSLSDEMSMPAGIGMGGGLMGSMSSPLSSGVAQGTPAQTQSPFLQMALQQAMKNSGGQAAPSMSPLSAAQDNGQAGVTLGAPQQAIPALNPQILARALQRFQG